MPFTFGPFRRLLRLVTPRGPGPASAVGLEPGSWPDTEALLGSAGTKARSDEDIRYLAPLLASPDAAESVRAEAATAAWLARIRPSRLPRVDEAFRLFGFFYDRRAKAWHELSSLRLDSLRGGEGPSRPLVMLASFHASGFIRQKATQVLSLLTDGTEVPFLLIRANDWVAAVQKVAEAALKDRLRADHAAHFARNLPLVLRLEDVTRRDHAELVRRVRVLLAETDGGRHLVEALRSPDPVVRRACFRAAEATGAPPGPLLREAATSSDPALRLAAVRLALSMPASGELRQLVAKWTVDRFVPVRREALVLLAERFPDSAPQALNEFLFDDNATVRATARFYLRRLGVTDFAGLYREALGANVRHRPSALRGLGETGERKDAEVILPFLDATGPSIRRASVEALAALDREGQLGRLVALLADPAPGVSREARESLEGHAVTLSAERLWNAFEGTPFLHARQNVLAVMARLSRWESLPCVVRACAAAEKPVAQKAQIALESWLAGYNRQFFSRPTLLQRDRLRDALGSARSRLPVSAAAELQVIVESNDGTA